MNQLYPVFLKLHELRLLIVGAGVVGHEKLSFILKSSPNARITMVAPEVNAAVSDLLAQRPEARVVLVRRKFMRQDVRNADLIIAATDLPMLNRRVRDAAKAAGKLVNVADTPDLCDFYLGSIVTRGDLKIAISTNGQSPTFAKRFRQLLEEILPVETTELLTHLRTVRDRLGGDFAEKVRALNRLTASLVRHGARTTHCVGCPAAPQKISEDTADYTK